MTTEYINYFAYGSNLLPLRLSQRVASSRSLGQAVLPGYRLAFHKKGADASAKCNVFQSGSGEHQVYGVVYQMLASERVLLDQAESLGAGYDLVWQDIELRGEPTRVFFYQAPAGYIDDSLLPYHWYKQLVVQGARYHRLPETWLALLQQVESRQDPDRERDALHQRILEAARG